MLHRSMVRRSKKCERKSSADSKVNVEGEIKRYWFNSLILAIHLSRSIMMLQRLKHVIIKGFNNDDINVSW